jgi:hypothetical protein
MMIHYGPTTRSGLMKMPIYNIIIIIITRGVVSDIRLSVTGMAQCGSTPGLADHPKRKVGDDRGVWYPKKNPLFTKNFPDDIF